MSDGISIVVPVYNVPEKYLRACIESLINQTYKVIEIILVDDGSDDICPQKCEEWKAKDARIKVIHKINGGLSDARNAGLEIAGGLKSSISKTGAYRQLEIQDIIIPSMNG